MAAAADLYIPYSKPGLTHEILKERSNIRENRDFYYDYYDSGVKPVDEMTQEEKDEFEAIIRSDYFEWIGLTDEIFNENKDKMMHNIQQWLEHHLLAIFISKLENEIVNVHRDPEDITKVSLDGEIRSSNRSICKELDDKGGVYMSSIIDYVTHVKDFEALGLGERRFKF